MFQKILVAIDISPMAEQVFAKAINIAQTNSSLLMFLHILSDEEENSPLAVPPGLISMYPAKGNDLTLETWRKQWEEFQAQGIEMLKSYVEKAKDINIYAQYKQSIGKPSRSICDFAEEWDADLIVLGRRGRTGISEMFLGSVSNYVLHHAPCSVLIVQGDS